jgi:hypothetical protein
MIFDELLAQAIEFLQRQGRVSYSALKVRFDTADLRDAEILLRQLL